MHKKGLTLIEIIVATLLIVLTLTGLVHLFVAGKRLILHNNTRLAVGELGKVFLDPLQMEVRQGENPAGALNGWDQINNLLYIPGALDSTTWTGGLQNLNGIAFTPVYTLARVKDTGGNDTGLRRVTLTVQWQEPAP